MGEHGVGLLYQGLWEKGETLIYQENLFIGEYREICKKIKN